MRAQTHQSTVAAVAARGRTGAAPRKPAAARRATLRTSAVAERTSPSSTVATRARDRSTRARGAGEDKRPEFDRCATGPPTRRRARRRWTPMVDSECVRRRPALSAVAFLTED